MARWSVTWGDVAVGTFECVTNIITIVKLTSYRGSSLSLINCGDSPATMQVATTINRALAHDGPARRVKDRGTARFGTNSEVSIDARSRDTMVCILRTSGD